MRSNDRCGNISRTCCIVTFVRAKYLSSAVLYDRYIIEDRKTIKGTRLKEFSEKCARRGSFENMRVAGNASFFDFISFPLFFFPFTIPQRRRYRCKMAIGPFENWPQPTLPERVLDQAVEEANSV